MPFALYGIRYALRAQGEVESGKIKGPGNVAILSVALSTLSNRFLYVLGNYPLIARVTRFTSTLETVYDKNMSGSKKKNPLRPSYEEGELRDESIEKKQRVSFQPNDLLRLIRKAVGKPSEESANP